MPFKKWGNDMPLDINCMMQRADGRWELQENSNLFGEKGVQGVIRQMEQEGYHICVKICTGGIRSLRGLCEDRIITDDNILSLGNHSLLKKENGKLCFYLAFSVQSAQATSAPSPIPTGSFASSSPTNPLSIGSFRFNQEPLENSRSKMQEQQGFDDWHKRVIQESRMAAASYDLVTPIVTKSAQRPPRTPASPMRSTSSRGPSQGSEHVQAEVPTYELFPTCFRQMNRDALIYLFFAISDPKDYRWATLEIRQQWLNRSVCYYVGNYLYTPDEYGFCQGQVQGQECGRTVGWLHRHHCRTCGCLLCDRHAIIQTPSDIRICLQGNNTPTYFCQQCLDLMKNSRYT